MKNQMWVWVVLAVVVLGGVYMYKSQIKSMLMGGASVPAPIAQTSPAASPTETVVDLVIATTGTPKGDYLTGSTGMTLYSYDKDAAGVSNCTGTCVEKWPPYTTTIKSTKLPSNLTTLKRAGGSLQFAYKGMPLYYWVSDTKPGDTTGDGVGGVWHLVKP